MISWNPYRMYRAWKSGQRPFVVSSGLRIRTVWGSSLKQVQKKFRKWNVHGIAMVDGHERLTIGHHRHSAKRKLKICLDVDPVWR